MTIKEFDILYTLDSKRAIRIFTCRVDKVSIDLYQIITSTGKLNGKLTEKIEVVKKGKQKRTVEEQAIFQAASLWKTKLDEGYKSEDQLVKELVGKGVDVPAGINALISHCNHHIPDWYQTNSNFDPLPMLAHKYKDIKEKKFPYYGQPKLDGVRCLVKYDTKLQEVKLCSRGGQYYKIPHLSIQLNILFDNLKNVVDDISKVVLDGEIYKHGVSLQEISGAARREEDGMFASNDWLEYHIYDIILNNNQKQQERIALLSILDDHFTLDTPNLKVVETKIINNESVLLLDHATYVNQGYEGLILRHPEGLYEFNQRSYNLIKVKEYQDEEFKIIGCEIDTNKTIEESFCFVLENNINPEQTFKARPTGTAEMKKKWYDTIDDIIGNKATVRFFNRSNSGIPTQGSVRHKSSTVLHIRPYGE